MAYFKLLHLCFCKAVIPLEDESKVKSITAYDLKGKRIALGSEKPPAIPTFVIRPAEEASLEPPQPLIKSEKPGKEENPERVFDDFLGSKTIDYKGLPYAGYTHMNFAHGGIMVDRD